MSAAAGRPGARLWREARPVVAFAAVVLVLALLIRSLLVEPVALTGRSMLPTLLPGDRLWVTKYAYGYNRYSLPAGLVPVDGRLFARPVARGDLIAFRLLRGGGDTFVKRVIGLPGETVRLDRGRVLIDGRPVARTALPALVWPASSGLCPEGVAVSDGQCRVDRWREALPNGVAYQVLDVQKDGSDETTRAFQVPAGHLFVLGDNRDRSKDSRHPLSVGAGYVPLDRVLGRVDRVLYSRPPQAAPVWRLWGQRDERAFRPDRWWKEL
ncbi:signal peptidase I [Rhodothalassium salexigens DSM 2132]|uniref:Signal peptidase I n=1 Tax=Rhodothalassium salexigens DSM 2132 TaxID=1188247 RepID=A0A4R2PF83_RHOSA|nr:signal peptidase I [Rhodothalassium salexigens]MBB4211760.1 signal peptidase I [Rhodothalassium salexigens DSM 2132]MBK1639625.1 signal peptidase I [Rhodothalassium salexigens DSM 2132]TCP33942.1 signal peptidase I [Rhodothalassium salexigens DSM 2132]